MLQENNKNLILAIVLSIAIILFFQVYFAPPPPTAPPPTTPGTTSGVQPATPPGVVPPPGTAPPKLAREVALKASQRVALESPRVQGSIALKGAQIDDITLRRFRETIAKDSANVQLLNPAGIGKGAYFVQFGWTAPTGAAPVDLPGDATVWSADGTALTPGKPVTLTWTNKDGVKFTRRFEIDGDYVITVSDKVENSSAQPIQLAPFSLARLVGEPKTLGFFILHEGPIGVFRGAADKSPVINDPGYSDLRDKGVISEPSIGGWLGFTDHYWLVALLPDQTKKVQSAYRYNKATDTYQADYIGESAPVAPGGSAEAVHRVFAGAKEVKLLREYEAKLGAPKFEWAIDFGWFWFFTKPFLDLLLWLNGLVGNFGIAILMITVLVKVVFFPLANKSYKSMAQMKKLQPEMQRLREMYGDDKQKMNQELMALYRNAKVNPAAGCLPIVLQIPVFFALYKVLFISIEMRHAPFFAWIQDLSAKDPTTVFNLFGLLPWSAPGGFITDFNLGIWPLIMGVTMWLQHQLNPPAPDPIQRKVFAWMPVIFTFMLASFPAGLVIYWAWNNVLSIGQQWIIMKKSGALASAPNTSVPRNIKELEERKAAKAAAAEKPKAEQ